KSAIDTSGAGNVTPEITATSTPRVAAISGAYGISGVANTYDMYFTQTGGAWGVWRSETGGTYAETPAAGWSGATGEVETVLGQVQSYSISRLTGTSWTDGQIAGTTSGRFLSMTEWGRTSGDILGVYGSGNWQAVAMGKIEQTGTLAFSSALTGNLYRVVSGTVHSREYQQPNWNVLSSWFEPLRYETHYFVPAEGTYDVTKTIAFESVRSKSGNYINSDDYQYYANGKWVKISKGQGITFAAGSGNTSDITGLDFSDPATSPNFAGTIVADPATPFTSDGNYVYASYSAWATNALTQNGAFTGILGALNNVSLWSSNSGNKMDIILMGSHDPYNGSQIFDTTTSYDGSGAGNGAFLGKLTGVIQDTNTATTYSENPLTGLIIGLYVDPEGNAGVLKGNFTGASYTGINLWESTDQAGAATLYRYSTQVSGLSASDLLTDGYIFWGNIGANINSTFNGTFGGNGKIYSPIGIMGSTFSIASQPDWGIFTMKIGMADAYENPTSATTWTSSLFGSGMFGQYP
ncbi:MAG: hypothetical protein CVU72_06145, partial [Deltaproteobacteria bacterium HGW-Deltaproteobacteria-7]